LTELERGSSLTKKRPKWQNRTAGLNSPGHHLDRRATAGKTTRPKNRKGIKERLLAQETRRKSARWQMDKPGTNFCQPMNRAKIDIAGQPGWRAKRRPEKSGGRTAGKVTTPKNHFADDETAGNPPGGRNARKM
jgi:hypothetical protein